MRYYFDNSMDVTALARAVAHLRLVLDAMDNPESRNTVTIALDLTERTLLIMRAVAVIQDLRDDEIAADNHENVDALNVALSILGSVQPQ